MGQLQLVFFTLLWTVVWVAPWPRLPPRIELLAGLIPFAAFGLRVFAGFFVGVPADDPVRAAVGPLVNWVTGGTAWIPYAVVLDTTVALGLVWFAAAFDIPRKSRVATAWIMPAVAIAVTPVAAGIGAAVLWCAGGLPVERQAAADSVAALATGAVAGLVARTTCGFTRSRSRWLFALAVGVAAGAAVAARSA